MLLPNFPLSAFIIFILGLSSHVRASDWLKLSFRYPSVPPTHLEFFKTAGLDCSHVLESLEQGYSSDEIKGAIVVKKLHDKVEIAAYAGFIAGIQELGIVSDEITDEQSRFILKYVKQEAHRIMYSPDGYMSLRNEHLNFTTQIKPILDRVVWIVHDRDRRLTHGSYRSLSALLFALDSHNSLVNQIIFRAWGYPLSAARNHLHHVKDKVDFYPTLGRILSFDLSKSISEMSKRFSDSRIFTNVNTGKTLFGYGSDYISFEDGKGKLRTIYSGSFDEKLCDYLESEEIDFFLSNKLFDDGSFPTVRKYFEDLYPEVIIPKALEK